MSDNTTVQRIALVSMLVGLVLLGTSHAVAQSSGGAYVSLGVGFAQGANHLVGLSGPNHPTHCDRLLYADPADAPTGGDCAAPSELGGMFTMDPESGFTGGIALGYSMGALSFEGEFVQRHQIIHDAGYSLGELAGSAITGKETEWSAAAPPYGDMSEFQGRQFFGNVYFTLETDGGPSPYVGVGGGLSQVDFRFYSGFRRKSIAEGYLEAFGGSRSNPDAAPEWQRAAAGTMSSIVEPVSHTGFGYQVLAGFDLPLTEKTALGLKGRWVFNPDVQVDAEWASIRSHAGVHADGVTPFVTELDFTDLGYWAITLNMKYEL